MISLRSRCIPAAQLLQSHGDLKKKWTYAVEWLNDELERVSRAANQYGISVFCTDFTCKIREYVFGLQNTEIELCQFLSHKVLLPEQSLPVLGNKLVKICGILCLKTFKYLFNHQNIRKAVKLNHSLTHSPKHSFSISSTRGSNMCSPSTSCSGSTERIH